MCSICFFKQNRYKICDQNVFSTQYIKMYDISEYILEIRCLNHNNLKEYLENKLLSIYPFDITYTVFFKKLYVLLQNLPEYLNELDLKINENKDHFVNFWTDFLDNKYFYDTKGYIRINCLKLSNNGYLVSIPIKNGRKVILNIEIKTFIKR